jgi:uncharacterized SAM-binding protein YcdF (DUF218 family)
MGSGERRDRPRPASGGGRTAWGHAAEGLILGTLGWLGGRSLNLTDAFPFLRATDYDLLIAALLGAAIALTRQRKLLWILAGVVSAALLVVGYTPLIVQPARALVRRDPARECAAVVVLSSGIFGDGTLVCVAQDRLMRGLELVRQGYANRLVVTRLPRPWRSSVPAIREEMAALGFNIPLIEVGPAHNTHEEAVAVSRLARGKGWKQVLLVTSPLHTRRAGAVFQEAGLSVVVQPCPERRYDMSALRIPTHRFAAFQDWLYETVAWHVYQYKGWL